MKAYTNLEQSKKLAEILPIESADMMWEDWSLIDEGWKLSIGYYPEIEKDYGRKCYPAWSLAALLDLLPNQFNKCVKTLYWFNNTWHCDYMDEDSESEVSMSANNPVDACFEMFFELKRLIENNLL